MKKEYLNFIETLKHRGYTDLYDFLGHSGILSWLEKNYFGIYLSESINPETSLIAKELLDSIESCPYDESSTHSGWILYLVDDVMSGKRKFCDIDNAFTEDLFKSILDEIYEMNTSPKYLGLDYYDDIWGTFNMDFLVPYFTELVGRHSREEVLIYLNN